MALRADSTQLQRQAAGQPVRFGLLPPKPGGFFKPSRIPACETV
jgi:hypothetical protein